MMLFRQKESLSLTTLQPQRAVEDADYLYMLELINRARRQAGCSPVRRSENPAAQRHADDCLRTGHASHWNLAGLKPYMRYSRAGGYQTNAENVYQALRVGGRGITDVPGELDLAMKTLMDSPGHRRNILNRWFRKVGLGIAWNGTNLTVAQHFEGDYVEFRGLPSFSGGTLRFKGRLKNDVSINRPDDLKAYLWYDPPPRSLTVGQLMQVNGYDTGMIVAALRRPLPPGQYWQEDLAAVEIDRLPRPEYFPANSPKPRTVREWQKTVDRAYRNNGNLRRTGSTIPLITCNRWEVGPSHFDVSADLRGLIENAGPGVYTLALWASKGDTNEEAAIAQYSILIR